MAPMFFLLASTLARAADPAPVGAPTEALPPPPAVYDVVVVKKEAPPAPPERPVVPMPLPTVVSLPPGVGLRLTKGENWRVKDASDLRYSTIQFARLVGDGETLRRLDRSREFAGIGRTSLAITGIGLLVGSLVVATSTDAQPRRLDYSVDPDLYEDAAAYDAATEFSDDQYEKSLREWQSQRLGSALFLVGSAGVALAASPFIGRDNETVEDRPHCAYGREAAQAWLDRYNAANPPLPAPSAPPPEAAPSAPPPEAAPSAPPAPDPIRLDVQPLAGFGFVGITGRF